MPRRSEVVDLLAHGDPVRAFCQAQARGHLIGLRTSGTTRRPRLVVRTAASWSDSFETVALLGGMDSSSRVWVPGPLSASMNLFACAQAEGIGARVVDAASAATHAHLTPMALDRALDAGVMPAGAVVITAGDRLHPSLGARAAAAGLTLHHYYGASELSFVAWGGGEGDLRLFPGVEVRVDADQIWVRSPFVSLGYADGETDGPFGRREDGFATVGDRGALEGETLRVWGRGHDAITTAGATVLVADIEEVLRSHAVGDVVAVGVPHESVGSIVVGVVTEAGDVEVLAAVARAELSPAQRPRRWRVMPILPTTAAGKVDRAALRRMLADDTST